MMLRFLFRRQHLLPTTHLPAALTSTTPTRAFFLQCPPARPISSTLLPSPDADSAQKAGILTVPYLTETCGLSYEAASSIAEKLTLNDTHSPGSVLQLLKDYGFTKTDIASIVTKLPSLLKFDPCRNLKPKLEFLRGAGFVGVELAELLTVNPKILQRHLSRKIEPCVNFYKTILPSFADVARVLKLTSRSLTPGNGPNIEILRESGVPEDVIARIMVCRPRALDRSPERFTEAIRKVKAMGLDPAGGMLFAYAVCIMAYMSDSTWDKKTAFLRSLGWSDKEIALAFKKQPMFIALSEKDIHQKVDLFRNKFGWDPAFISARPRHLMISLEKTLIPRCAILSILVSKGFIKEKTKVASLLRISEEGFLDLCARKYEKELPQLLELYKSNLGCVASKAKNRT